MAHEEPLPAAEQPPRPAESDPAWHALKQSIEQSVALEATPIELGGRELNWYRVSNPDQLLDVAANSDPQGAQADMDPFWAATWRAALGLDRFLASIDLQDVDVLELGCGSGQAGTGAAIRGGRVTLTDSVPIALQVAQLNAWEFASRVSFRQLFWGTDDHNADKYPVVIGSDLVYDPGLFEKLEQSMRKHLRDAGAIYLSEPHRHSGDKFALWIRAAGWETIEHDVDMRDDRVSIRIFECRLPK